ncbi:MAG: MBOAT family protein [Lachnospiraceae bacterium]|nr:MBOAT family protein [Lachnospiraceae bacterium]
MSFTSLEFIFVFFPLCVAGYYILPKRCRNVFLLAASLIFYAAGEPGRMYILVLGIIVNYIFGILLSGNSRSANLRRAVLILSFIYNFGILFYYKYLMYRYGASNVSLPLGLSFFTFRTVSYCLDVYWEMMPANKSLSDVALYISFFPQISMGPISRYTDFAGDMYDRNFDAEEFFDGIKRIIAGLFKKLVIADTLLGTINLSFGMDADKRSVSLAWLGLIAFLIQLYFDFMGYTDIAIGIGKLFGFRLPENFDHPYAAESVTDFWNRWHMTLGIWMKNYIYIPIFRACQLKKFKQIRCYLLASLGVWLFVGAWHGVGMKTIYYGLYYYVLIAGERLYADWKKARRKRLGLKKKPQSLPSKIGAHVYMIIAIFIGQLLFRCESLGQYGDYILSLLHLSGNTLTQTETAFYLRQDAVPVLMGIIFSMPVVPYAVKKIKERGGEKIISILTPVVYGVMLITAFSFAFTSTYRSFVYFQF